MASQNKKINNVYYIPQRIPLAELTLKYEKDTFNTVAITYSHFRI